MKQFLIAIMLVISSPLRGHITRKKNVVWVLPSVGTKINGPADGLMINSLKDEKFSPTTIVNGVSVELIVAGFLSSPDAFCPVFGEPDTIYQNKVVRDSIIKTYDKAKYRINGFAPSGSGVGRHDLALNGVTISGINSLTSKTNGVSVCLLRNYRGVINGVSVAG